MKKIITALCIVALSATVVQARPHGSFHHRGGWGGPSYHFAPRHHHHGGDVAAGLAIGLIGGSILNAAFSQPRTVTTTTYSPVTYTPAVTYAPAVVSAPVVAPVAVSTSSPCYTTTNIVTGATTTNCSSTIVTGNYIFQ